MATADKTFRFVVSAAPSGPSWAGGLSLNAWTPIVTTNFLSNVYAADVGQYGNTGPKSVMEAWCSAVLATQLGASGSLIHWGGGHQDYYGGEIYRLDLSTATWSRMTDPYGGPYSFPNNDGVWPDGTPGATHSYYFIVYRSATNELVVTRRELTNTPSTVHKISRISLNSLSWINSSVSNGMASSPSSGEGAIYDSARDVVWSITRQDGLEWARYNFAADSWASFPEPSGVYNSGPAVYVPSKDCAVFFSSSSPNEVGLDPASPATNRVALVTSGTPPSFGAADGCCWSSNLGAIVYYPSRGNSIYLLTAPAGDWRTEAWAWSQRSMTGNTGTHSGANGTYGKFQIAEWGGTTVALVSANVSGNLIAARLA